MSGKGQRWGRSDRPWSWGPATALRLGWWGSWGCSAVRRGTGKGTSAICIAGERVHLQLDVWTVAQTCEWINALQVFREGDYLRSAFNSARDDSSVRELKGNLSSTQIFQRVESQISSTGAVWFPKELISPLGIYVTLHIQHVPHADLSLSILMIAGRFPREVWAPALKAALKKRWKLSEQKSESKGTN